MGILIVFSNLGGCYRTMLIQTTRKLSVNYAPKMNKYLPREGHMMNKLIGTSKKKRKLYFDETPSVTSGGKLSLGHNVRSNKENSRRVSVLNKLFMKNISDMLLNGNIAEDVIGKGLEISRVAMAPDFHQLNVFWTTSKEENVPDLEAVLPQVAFTLRHELSQLRVMGIVPRITFHKDKHYATLSKVNYLLSIADYGEDHIHKPLGSDFKNDASVKSSSLTTTQEISADTKEEKEINVDGTPLEEEAMPVMRQDVFNLQHDRVLNKIMKYLYKSRAMHRFQPNLAVESEGTTNSLSLVPVEQMTKQERKEALAKFILGRKILREQKSKNKYNTELKGPIIYGEEDIDEEIEDFCTEDFIEEDNLEDRNLKSSEL